MQHKIITNTAFHSVHIFASISIDKIIRKSVVQKMWIVFTQKPAEFTPPYGTPGVFGAFIRGHTVQMSTRSLAPENRVPGLSCVILQLDVLTQYQHVTDGRMTTANIHASIASHG